MAAEAVSHWSPSVGGMPCFSEMEHALVT
jgi:hypothetical protein